MKTNDVKSGQPGDMGFGSLTVRTKERSERVQQQQNFNRKVAKSHVVTRCRPWSHGHCQV